MDRVEVLQPFRFQGPDGGDASVTRGLYWVTQDSFYKRFERCEDRTVVYEVPLDMYRGLVRGGKLNELG